LTETIQSPVSDDRRPFDVHERRYTGLRLRGNAHELPPDHVLPKRSAAAALTTSRTMPTRTQQLGLIIVLAALVVYVFIRVL
jgi:hypothetical protein